MYIIVFVGVNFLFLRKENDKVITESWRGKFQNDLISQPDQLRTPQTMYFSFFYLSEISSALRRCSFLPIYLLVRK